MNRWAFAIPTLLVAGMALAQQPEPTELPAVRVMVMHGGPEEFVTVSCKTPDEMTMDDVQRVLDVKDPTKVLGLRKQLVAAATEACSARIEKIMVSRTGDSSDVTWKAAD